MKKTFLLFSMAASLFCSCENKETKNEADSSADTTETSNADVSAQVLDAGDGKYAIKVHNLYFEVDSKTAGRVSSFKVDDKEILSSKEVAAYWGSTFLPSPESEWGWPPSAVLDSDPYAGGIEGSSIILKGNKDPELGYSFTKEFFADPKDTSIVLKYTITNNSDKEKKVAPWEITRVLAGGITFYPSGKKPYWGELSKQYKDSLGITWYRYDSTALTTDVKGFGDGTEGWMAHANKGLLFIKSFPEVPVEKQAPKEGEVEIYADADKNYVEIEQQGPLATLKPGESTTWEVKWYLKNLPEGMAIKTGNEALSNYVRSILK